MNFEFKNEIEGRNMNIDNDLLAENIAKNLQWTQCWKQGSGEYGGLHLHFCWGESGVLEKKYQGITVSSYEALVPAMLELYKKTDSEEFLKEAQAMVECLASLQMPQGCLNHSVYEFEPGYGGLIHNAWGFLAIVRYMKFLKEKNENNSYQKYKKIVEKGLRWFEKYWFHRGNRFTGRLDKYPKIPVKGSFKEVPLWASCTNQDLALVLLMLEWAELTCDYSYMEKRGIPAIKWLRENYFLGDIGQYIRGDTENFVELAPYCCVIAYELIRLNSYLKDDSLIKMVSRNLTTIKNHCWKDRFGCLRLPEGYHINEKKMFLKPSAVSSGTELIRAIILLEKKYKIMDFYEYKNQLLKTIAFYQSLRGGERTVTNRGDFMDIAPNTANFSVLLTLVELWDGNNLPKIELPDVSVNVVSGATWIEDKKTWQLEHNRTIKSGVKNKVNGIFDNKRFLNIKAYLKSEDNIELFLNDDLNDKLIAIEYTFCRKIELNIRSRVKTEILVKSLRKPKFDIKGNGDFVESKKMMQGYFLSKIQIKKGETKVKAVDFES